MLVTGRFRVFIAVLPRDVHLIAVGVVTSGAVSGSSFRLELDAVEGRVTAWLAMFWSAAVLATGAVGVYGINRVHLSHPARIQS